MKRFFERTDQNQQNVNTVRHLVLTEIYYDFVRNIHENDRNYPFEIVVNWNAHSFIWSILASRPFNPNADKWSAWFDYGQGNGRLNRNKFNLNELIGYLFVINEDRERDCISNECCYLNTNTFEYSLHTHWSVCVCFRYPFLLLLVAALLRSIVTQKLDFHVSNTESIR